MENLAIIPARSGSKGLRNKNIKLLNGVPLLTYSIRAAYESKLFSEIMVSTDSAEYADIARKYGATVPFMRSKELSTDHAGSWDVVHEILLEYQKLGKKFDTICLLQPTSPLRQAEDIIKGYSLFSQKKAEAVTSVCEVDHSPLWSMKLTEDLSLKEFRKSCKANSPRQMLDRYFRINGALYIRKIEYRKNAICILDEDEYAFIMDREKSIDIDTELDFFLAQEIMKYLAR